MSTPVQPPEVTLVSLRRNITEGTDADAYMRLASGTVKKVIEINPYLLGTMAGGAGTLFPPVVKI